MARRKQQPTPAGARALEHLEALRTKDDLSSSDRARMQAILTRFGGESNRTKSGIDTRKAAREMGISHYEVKKYAAVATPPPAMNRGQVFTAMTGLRGADVSGESVGQDGQPKGDLRGMLLAVGGKSSRTKSGIDLTAAAKKLGVSRRTAERWVQSSEQGKGQRPSAKHLDNLTERARQAATTKAGRTGHAQKLRQSMSRGGTLEVTGLQGPNRAQTDYLRDATVTKDLSPEDAEAMINAWENGGDAGFESWMSGFMGDRQMTGWTVSSVSDLSIKPTTRGR